jgi:hypothetical protein
LDSGYELLATSGAADASPPPVVEFNCLKSIFKQTLDHFNAADTRFFKQVFWVCDSAFPDSQAEQEREPQSTRSKPGSCRAHCPVASIAKQQQQVDGDNCQAVALQLPTATLHERRQTRSVAVYAQA